MFIKLKENETMQDLVDRLARSFELVNDIAPVAYWYEDLYPNGRIIDIHFSNHLRQMLGYHSEEEFPDDLNSFISFMHPDDVQAMLDAAIAAGTGKTDGYDLKYRIRKADGSYMWANATGEVVKDFEGTTVGMYGGFIDINPQKELEEQQQHYNAVIKALSSEYASVYFADMDSNTMVVYSNSGRITNQFGDNAFADMSFTDAVEEYISKACIEKDKPALRQALSKDYIRQQLRDKNYFTLIYQNYLEQYTEMKCVRGDDSGVIRNIVVGFAEKDAEIRERLQAEAERQMNFDIIEILASEYSSVYYIDLKTDGLNPYTMNAETETTFGSVFRSGITYSEAYKLYVDKLIFPEDKAMMLKAGSVGNIKKELANKKTFLTTYRNSDNKYSEMKFVKVGGDNDEPVAVALGFAEKDEQIRQEQAIEQERQMNFDIIEILASEYTSVYYIDLTTGGLNPYTMNAETETTFGSVFRSGITYSEAYRLYVDKLVFPEDKAMMLKAGAIGNIMKELRTKKTFLTTYRNAEGHYSEMKFVKVGNEDGTPTAVALGFADKDEELRAKQEEERILQRNIDIIEILASEYTSVYYIDMTTDELDPYTMNEQTETQFGEIFRSGIKYSDAFRLYVDKFVYPADKAMMLKAGSVYNILDELSSKKTFFTQYRNSNGEYCEMKFVKVGDEENPQSVALGFSNKDAEIRKEIERKEREARDNAVISGLSDDFGCVVYTDYDKADEVHYRFDPLFEKHIEGWSRITNFRERLDRLTGTIMHPEDRVAFREATSAAMVKAAVDRDGVYFVNFRTLIDGVETYYQAKFARDELHPETNFIAGFHNVDAETKREMKALEQAKSASKAKTDFLFNMSHDIRTPMNAIIGFTKMAMRDKDDPEKVRECLHKVQLSSDMLLSLINDILDMSRIESGKAELHEKKWDIFDAFDSFGTTMESLAASKDIDLKFGFGEIRDRYIFADGPRADRVLVNIISNAIKYTPANGHVSVNLDQLADTKLADTKTADTKTAYTKTADTKSNDTKLVDKKPGYGNYRFMIADNGIGMSEEFQKRMFDEFSREENSTISGVQGTGLGLSLAKKLVEMMDGSITCESRQGIGTTFTIVLPFRLQTEDDIRAEDEEVQHRTALDFNGRKVLLVEDNDLNREIALDILEENGMIVDTAVNGRISVDMIKAKGPEYYDFILMDIQMPVMSGYDATREIRALYPDAKIPIIALSANAFEEDRKTALEVGMDEHIAKPINVETLKETLAKFQ